MNKFIVSFQPSGKKIEADEGLNILALAQNHNIEIPAICGGEKLCGKCIVKIELGIKDPTPIEKKYFSDKELADGLRLACKTTISSNTTVWLINQKEMESIKILTTGAELSIKIENDLNLLDLKLEKPSLENQLSLSESLKNEISRQISIEKEEINISYPILKDLPETIEKSNYKPFVIINGSDICNILPERYMQNKYGIAVDLGTTTIVGLLIDLESGNTLSVASRTNPQVSIGADVITRINYSINNNDGLNKLHTLVIDSINEIIGEVCENINPDSVFQFALAGNAVMNHIFLKVDPKIIAFSPYLPVYKDIIEIRAAEIGIKINPSGKVFILPNISGYVGGDIVGLIISQDLLNTDKITLALDLGTNGEIVLGSNKKLLCCATAAGPAFEGGHISNGMRASKGAIDKVSIFENILHYHTIENSPAKGICGTGLLDLVSELLEYEVIDETGRILGNDELTARGLLLEKHIKPNGSQNEFHIFNVHESSNTIILKQQDVRELQLAKGAIRAGIAILMSSLGITDNDIDQILIAGAFGSYINKESAMRIGLIPKIDITKVISIGNSASIGAKQFLLSKTKRIEAHESIQKVEYIELCNIPQFQDRFMEEMMF